MSLKQLFLLLMSSLAALSVCAGEYKISIPAGAIPAEVTAADILRDSMRRISGVELKIVRGKASSPAIYVGNSDQAKALTKVDFTALKPDEIILKRVDNDLVLAGQRPRGSIYAVYEFLERYYGVRFWTAETTYYPKQSVFILPGKVDFRYAPPFRYRQAHYDLLREAPLFAVKLRDNGTVQIPKKDGGTFPRAKGDIHAFGYLLPAKKYFSQHPEWYSEINGKRQSKNAQLCLSNPECRKEMVRAALEHMRKHPDQKLFNFSQNDNRKYCQCVACKAFVAKNGNQTDLLMLAANQVAEAIEKEFPGVWVRTIAYEYTRKPPKTIMPHRNVLIQYCDIECDFGKSLDDPANAVFAQEIKQWRVIAPKLRVWHYVTNFSCYLLPFPNWNVLGKDMRFLADNKVDGVFAQGSYYAGHAGDLSDLRVWLVCKLMWNPDQDENKLIDEFLNGYYGAAAPEIKKYINVMNAAIQERPKAQLRCFMTSVRSWLSKQKTKEALQVIQEARRKVADNPELLKRVEIAAIPITIASFDHPELLDKQNKSKLVDRLIELCRQGGATRTGESQKFDALRRRFVVLRFNPEYRQTVFCRKIANGSEFRP